VWRGLLCLRWALPVPPSARPCPHPHRCVVWIYTRWPCLARRQRWGVLEHKATGEALLRTRAPFSWQGTASAGDCEAMGSRARHAAYPLGRSVHRGRASRHWSSIVCACACVRAGKGGVRGWGGGVSTRIESRDLGRARSRAQGYPLQGARRLLCASLRASLVGAEMPRSEVRGPRAEGGGRSSAAPAYCTADGCWRCSAYSRRLMSCSSPLPRLSLVA